MLCVAITQLLATATRTQHVTRNLWTAQRVEIVKDDAALFYAKQIARD